jgi:predicted phage terminase large subunit-like protein
MIPDNGVIDIDYSDLAYEIAKEAARTSLSRFIRFIDEGYSCKWFHKVICDAIDNLIDGKIKNLAVFIPPQHGKTAIISRYAPAYILGRNHNLKIGACAYSSDRAQEYNRMVQRVIDDPVYKDLFPDTKLNGKNVVTDSKGVWLRNADHFEIVDKKGAYRSVGVMGPLTGFSVDVAIIDDPVKDNIEAQSKVYRDRLWEWYQTVLLSRLHNDSRQILVMTRWHEDDLAGRILRGQRNWEVISLPALREQNKTIESDPRAEGEALWPEKHSADSIKERAKSPRVFASLYQQRPAPEEGGIFKKFWFRRWAQLPLMDELIISWDMTFKETGTSYVVGQVWGRSGANSYLVDMVRGKWDFPETVSNVKALCNRFKQSGAVYIEEKANGAAIISTLRDVIPGIIPVLPKESKEARAYAVSYICEAGNVYLPQNSDWIDTAINEICTFPNAQNDDIVDAMTQALDKLYLSSGSWAANIAI